MIPFLVPFKSVITKALAGRSYHEFNSLQRVGDFVDGFRIHRGGFLSMQTLQAQLKSHHLECLPLRRTKMSEYVFGQQLHGPHTIPFTIKALCDVAKTIRNSSEELKK